MDKYKITQNEINENNVKSAADLLKGEPRDNKNIFDRLPELIVGKVNGFIDAVISKFSDYYNKTEIDGKENVLNEEINTKANADEVYKKTETYTKGEVDSKETALSDRINAKANSADVYAKSETYTKAETDTKIDAKANASDVYTKAQTYTKEETNVAINEKVNELGAGDMAKAVYDKNNNGVVDKAETADNAENAEKLNGQPASYYASKTEVQTAQTTADNAIARLDDMGMGFLWQNASPTSEFDEQTSSLDLSEYDEFLFVHFPGTYLGTYYYTRVKKNVNTSFELFCAGSYNRYRTVTQLSNGFKFEKGRRQTAIQTAVDDNAVIIPYQIYGIR